MSLVDKIFGTHSERELKRIYPIVDKIEALRPTMQALSDEELGEYPGMRYEAAESDTVRFGRPIGQEDEQTRYQRELQEYAVKQAQYDRYAAAMK